MYERVRFIVNGSIFSFNLSSFVESEYIQTILDTKDPVEILKLNLSTKTTTVFEVECYEIFKRIDFFSNRSFILELINNDLINDNKIINYFKSIPTFNYDDYFAPVIYLKCWDRSCISKFLFSMKSVDEIDIEPCINYMQQYCKLYGCMKTCVNVKDNESQKLNNILTMLNRYNDDDLTHLARFVVTVGNKLWINIIGITVYSRCSEHRAVGNLNLTPIPSKYLKSVESLLCEILRV